ncbi:hypothetical protein IEQ34_019480 [Dendrobium chrysotoxum]|uniref:Uncharacterized protein n=1 Tax=Dendrobium chrysotoxum TaxID=161865 RepID=A0AAV7G7G8_DENCH|nr:hypothetical protein IEQ34_019480 [Dendrobium chrysotoxum]
MAGGAKRTDGDGIAEVRWGVAARADGEGDDVGAVCNGGVHGGEDIRVKAACGPADLVGGDAGFSGDPSGFALGVAKEASA